MSDSIERPPLQMQALARAIARVGIKHSDPTLTKLTQEL
jgi:hypothetical protein